MTLPLPFGAVASRVADAVARFEMVLDSAAFRRELDRLARTQWGWGAPVDVRLRALKAHRRRCTFDVSMSTASGPHRIIAKVHTEDRGDVVRTMEAIRHAGFGADAECAIPEPLAYLPELHVLLEERIDGSQAMAVFLAGDPDEELATAERCGRWLARLHTVGPHLGDAIDPHAPAGHWERWTSQIRGAGEPLASAAESLLRKLQAATPVTRPVPPCAGHGSYIPEHVLLHGARTVTIDFDEYDLADPGRDLAWFSVSLQRLGLKYRGSLRAFDHVVEAFLRAYVARGRADAAASVGFYRAVECLHRAWRDLYKGIPPRREWAALMLNEGLRQL